MEMMTFEVKQAGNAEHEPGRRQINDSNASDANEEDQPPGKKVKKSLAKLLGQVKKTSDPGNATSPVGRIDLEMSRYVSAPEIELHADPLQWWSIHAAAYPLLAKLARKYGTSSASERLFSAAGNIVTAKRSSLKPHKANMLVFLAKNL